jgi:hypothetical protein
MSLVLSTDISEERITSIIRVTTIGELGTMLTVTSNRSMLHRNNCNFITLMIEAMRSSEMSVLTRATRGHIQERGILHSHRRENLLTYIALTGWTL